MSSQKDCTTIGRSNHTGYDWDFGTAGYIAAGFVTMLFIVIVVFTIRYIYALWNGRREQRKKDLKTAVRNNPDSLQTPLQDFVDGEELSRDDDNSDTIIFSPVDTLPKESNTDSQPRTSSA